MAATTYAVLGQFGGSSWDNAFPQPTGQGVGGQNLDLIHIRDQGNTVLARVNHAGVVAAGPLASLVLTSVAVTSFTVTQVTASTGVVLGTFTGGGSNAFAGLQVAILGFTNSGNNGTFTITASSATQITIIPIAGLMDETHAATASVYSVSTATYNGTITNGGSNALVGSTATVTGFTNSTNNATATITSSTTTTIVVPFAGQIAETHAGAAAIGLLYSKGGARIGTFFTRLGSTATAAQIFADAFANPAQQDIIQIVSLTGLNVVNYIDYTGTSH